jgi:anti-sigma factor RsiW
MTAKTCEQTIALLLDYVEDRLSPQERAALDEHFVACPPCVEFLSSYRRVPEIVRRATDVTPPAEVSERLARVLADRKRSR